tara:strand:- start:657 stop:779 length:123 start_codon:yes stop_codon:yes gene_type:complete
MKGRDALAFPSIIEQEDDVEAREGVLELSKRDKHRHRGHT